MILIKKDSPKCARNINNYLFLYLIKYKINFYFFIEITVQDTEYVTHLQEIARNNFKIVI